MRVTFLIFTFFFAAIVYKTSTTILYQVIFENIYDFIFLVKYILLDSLFKIFISVTAVVCVLSENKYLLSVVMLFYIYCVQDTPVYV